MTGKIICGLDEAGRGVLAGPLVETAVILNGQADKIRTFNNAPLKDGKILTPQQRNKMKELHLQHPHYSWNYNIGYGTKKHLSAINDFGTSPFHRDVFVTTALKNQQVTVL